jgi:hypothetical protein
LLHINLLYFPLPSNNATPCNCTGNKRTTFSCTLVITRVFHYAKWRSGPSSPGMIQFSSWNFLSALIHCHLFIANISGFSCPKFNIRCPNITTKSSIEKPSSAVFRMTCSLVPGWNIDLHMGYLAIFHHFLLPLEVYSGASYWIRLTSSSRLISFHLISSHLKCPRTTDS